jgi:type II secretory pathway pseudopilin PulG
MAMVLVILGVLAAVFLSATNTMLDNSRRKETRSKLEALESAITRFVMTTGRLPCPADGSLGPANPNQGVELAAGGVCTVAALTNGVVPWRSLSVPQTAALDAWNNLITYRVWGGAGVANSLTASNALSMTSLDPGTAGVVSTWLQTRGFRACKADPCPATLQINPPGIDELARKVDGNGVAYFLISHGANKVGAYSADGVLVSTANGPGPGLSEVTNSNGVLIRTTSPSDFYVDADLREDSANPYDDMVLRPTVMKVALDAALGPRAP